MHLKAINQKFIKNRCGTVSYKSGLAYYQSNKVTITEYSVNYCEAAVMGEDEFNVTISEVNNGDIRSECSCPKLASYNKECQHIAAVLIALEHKQRAGDRQGEEDTEDFFTLFEDERKRTTGRQRHFEDRETIRVDIWIHTIHVPSGSEMIGIELSLDSIKIKNIRAFLNSLQGGTVFPVSDSFTFDQKRHCFDNVTDVVLHHLVKVSVDESLFFTTNESNPGRMLIPPSSWDRLLPLLLKAPNVKVQQANTIFGEFQQKELPLPLEFSFGQAQDDGYRLYISGLRTLVILSDYQTVIHKGTFTLLDSDDCKRLVELKRLLFISGEDFIPIPQERIGFFLEKVATGLKKLGNVQLSKQLSHKMGGSPLIAKLYLDRVKNRLLAGVEFHYGQVVIHPLENREPPSGSLIIRETEKEDTILELMEEFSFGRTEGGYFLHNGDLEYEFLTYGVPKIGGLTQIYATTAVRSRVFKGYNLPAIRVKVKKERMNWLEFKFEMNGIPDRQVMEILEALEEKRKYYRMKNGSLLSLESNEFQDLQRFLISSKAEKHDLLKGLELPLNQNLHLLDTVDENHTFKLDASFHELLEHLRYPEKMTFTTPSTLEPLLREYQKKGFQWMKTLAFYGFGGVLADDMGLGKTIQAITFIASVVEEIRCKKRPVLIVCPSSLTYNWDNEIEKFYPELNTIIMDGNRQERMKKQEGLEDKDIIIVSYPLLRSDSRWYEEQEFHTVIFDEAQAFKNPLTQTARSVKKIDANHRFALTGTPVENSLEELWAIFHVVFPTLFQGLKDYSRLTNKDVAKRIRPFVLRRLKEDVLSELPQKRTITESKEMLPEQKEVYAAYLAKLRHDTLKHLDKHTLRKNKIKILAGLTRLRQICCHPSLFVEGYKGTSAKFIQLMEILEESRLSGRKVLIFSQFTTMLELIGRELSLRGRTFFYLNGSTPSEDRLNMCNRFNQGDGDLFLISLKAGGTGLNLTSADTVILYDTWWNPAVEEQASDRAHRMGQKNNVQVIKLIASGTIEEKMNELQDKKRNLIQEVIDHDEQGTSHMTEEDLKEILSL
ncbi:DEAD/DEAH box helicase (plasmid) [Cytobacillus spongiae]|nr:DEAD/DEAH box helicase [Cytobacillus spongiae]UII58686.1 DEAD/DEAH box helicase [Cytobacillus spongiae]